MRDYIFPEKVELSVRLCVAQAVTVLFLILSLMSFSLPYASSIRPEFFAMLVYYWAVYRPTLVSPFFVFLFGITIDIISGLPIGLNAIVLVALQLLVQRQRLFLMGQSFMGLWTGFMVAVFALVFVKWIIMCVISFHILPLGSVLASGLTSIFIFPLMALLLLGVHKILPISD